MADNTFVEELTGSVIEKQTELVQEEQTEEMSELLRPELVNLNAPLTLDLLATTKKSVSDCYYNFKRDFSWTPFPIIAAGYIAKSQKKNFRCRLSRIKVS